MRYETILKRLKEIRESKSGKELFKKLNNLIEALEIKVEDEKKRKGKYGKAIQHLVGWYLKAWNNKPPESFGRTNYQAVIGKTFRELLIIYENNDLEFEGLKKDYQAFMEGNNIPNFLLGDKSITRFKTVLPQLKQLQTKKKTTKKWTSPENERGLDYYLNAAKKDPNQPEEIDNDDVPF